jgi:Carbonic anhydrase
MSLTKREVRRSTDPAARLRRGRSPSCSRDRRRGGGSPAAGPPERDRRPGRTTTPTLPWTSAYSTPFARPGQTGTGGKLTREPCGRCWRVESNHDCADGIAVKTATGNLCLVPGKLEPPNQTIARRVEVASHQDPFAVVFSCIDSRVSPEIAFVTGIGDLFEIRAGARVLDQGIVLGRVEFGPYAYESAGCWCPSRAGRSRAPTRCADYPPAARTTHPLRGLPTPCAVTKYPKSRKAPAQRVGRRRNGWEVGPNGWVVRARGGKWQLEAGGGIRNGGCLASFLPGLPFRPRGTSRLVRRRS